MKHNMDCVSVINVSFVSWILWYEMTIFPTWDSCICRCYPTLTVTGSYTDNISIYVSCAEEKIFIKNTSVPHILYMSDDISGPLDEVIKYACNYDQVVDHYLLITWNQEKNKFVRMTLSYLEFIYDIMWHVNWHRQLNIALGS